MAIYFNEKFRQLRKTRDLTQEQVAGVFNVSPQTVSRWETGVNLPDIEMLPPLAAFFKVTVDDLLGVDLAHKQAKARQFRDAIHEKYRENQFDEAIALARKAVAELPNDYSLLSLLALALQRKANDAPKEEREKLVREIILIHKRIVAECPDSPGDCTKANSLQQLAWAYNLIGEKQTAMEYAKGLPFYSSEVMRWIILEGEEKLAKTVENISIFASLILEHIAFLEECENAPPPIDEALALCKRIAENFNAIRANTLRTEILQC